MSPFVELILILAILITAAKTAGYISYRLGQPSVLGELIAGVILGPSLIDLLNLSIFEYGHLSESIHHIGEIGVLLLMFLAGLELHLTDLRKSGKVAAFAGGLGVLLPLILGTITGLAFQMTLSESIFLGLVLSATSVSISAQTLIELKVLRSRVGISLLGAAVFDDVLVVLGLSIFSALALASNPGGWESIFWIVFRMLIFLSLAIIIGSFTFSPLSRFVNKLPISQGLVALSMVLMLVYGWAAEEIGQMAAITGAFLAGLLLAQSPVKEKIEHGIASLAFGFFVPVFFIDVGLRANIREIGIDTLLFFGVMIIVAIIGKIIGSGAGALLGGLSRRESLQLGIGMMSRGEVGLIVASVGITEGIITQSIYSAVIGVVVITTLLTPPFLRASFSTNKSKPQPPPKPKVSAQLPIPPVSSNEGEDNELSGGSDRR